MLLKQPNVDALACLKTLELKGVGCTDLPASLAECQLLEKLEISNNPGLQKLPQVIAALPQLRILFASGIGLQEIPSGFEQCPKLFMLGVKDNSLTVLNGHHLPSSLVWLIAAGNKIEALPGLGRLKHVRKLMLSNNCLTSDALAPAAEIEDLEMIRVAANRLEALPEALLRHKKLAWVAIGSNPFTEAAMEEVLAKAPTNLETAYSEVSCGDRLGSGAGATVYKAVWREKEVALKLWENLHFSDGTAYGEWAANRLAGDPGHETLVRVHGVFKEPLGMIMELLVGSQQAASPPSFATVTRDNLRANGGSGPTYTPQAARAIAASVARACQYLRSKGLHHGDVYLHNTLVVCDDPQGTKTGVSIRDVRLTDFGAATTAPESCFRALEKLEVRSFGWLVQDLLESIEGTPSAENEAVLAKLKHVRALCSNDLVDKIPTFQDLVPLLVDAAVPKSAPAPTPPSTL